MSDFAETPRLDELKSLAETNPEPQWDFRLLEKYPEANLLVHVELCGNNGMEIHEVAMLKHESIADPDERATWLHEYVTTIVMIERQQRYNLASGSISSRGAVCEKVDSAFLSWRETGELPDRRFSA